MLYKVRLYQKLEKSVSRLVGLFTLLVSLLYFSKIIAKDPENARPKKILVLTIAKAGTHLIEPIVRQITKFEKHKLDFQHIREELLEKSNFDNSFILDHIRPDYAFLKKDESDEFIKVVLIRDPRDVLISLIYWMEKKEMAWLTLEQIRAFNTLPFDERITQAIKLPDANFGVKWFSKEAVEWAKNPSVFICKFEDLVGPEGGGTRQRQEKTIEALAHHLRCSLTAEEIAHIADHAFGNTWTFRKGKIGEWKSHFKPCHIDLFKKTMGNELIKLGYSEN